MRYCSTNLPNTFTLFISYIFHSNFLQNLPCFSIFTYFITGIKINECFVNIFYNMWHSNKSSTSQFLKDILSENHLEFLEQVTNGQFRTTAPFENTAGSHVELLRLNICLISSFQIWESSDVSKETQIDQNYFKEIYICLFLSTDCSSICLSASVLRKSKHPLSPNPPHSMLIIIWLNYRPNESCINNK